MTTTPTTGPITSRFGPRQAPVKPDGTLGSTNHQGTDIGAPVGRAVVAPQAGTVTASTHSPARGYYVAVDHGRYSTLHQHLSVRVVDVGDVVAEGQRIGAVGTSGGVAAHLHTEVHDGATPIDPDPWYTARGVTLGIGVQVLGETVTVQEESEMFIARVSGGPENGHTFLVDIPAGVVCRFPDTPTRQAVARAAELTERPVDQATLDHIRFMARLVLETVTGRHTESVLLANGSIGFAGH